MNEVLDNVQGMMPKVLDNALPDMTGPTIPEFKNPNHNWKYRRLKYPKSKSKR